MAIVLQRSTESFSSPPNRWVLGLNQLPRHDIIMKPVNFHLRHTCESLSGTNVHFSSTNNWENNAAVSRCPPWPGWNILSLPGQHLHSQATGGCGSATRDLHSQATGWCVSATSDLCLRGRHARDIQRGQTWKIISNSLIVPDSNEYDNACILKSDVTCRKKQM